MQWKNLKREYRRLVRLVYKRRVNIYGKPGAVEKWELECGHTLTDGMSRFTGRQRVACPYCELDAQRGARI